jgi:hypothetical protein
MGVMQAACDPRFEARDKDPVICKLCDSITLFLAASTIIITNEKVGQ